MYTIEEVAYVNGTNEVLVAHQNIGHADTKNNCQDPGTDKTLHGLLWRELDELSTTKGNSANVCKNVVANNKRDGEEKPDHSLEHIVHDEMCLYDNQIKGHMCPRKLGELKTIMSSLQRCYKKDKTYNRG